ncbi:MarR family winged helix-turn-helix transcriptional regulator [Staphylococcus sp. 17KM0847]|uniref:MarR family winged helix-turn-helix transcriptional regulator n=1 Tax=Staphylococcus sp. 17KM0847 TaxID=2583989 RepID=UPI0015DCFB21|nr:MarR family transcriptional regulator [Staphylococcus sp. 17KM0847]QLK86634.1 MarR family transcriptional regulator [Staphylococcus sp. 17KM0847]
MESAALFDHLTKLYRPYMKIVQPLLDEYTLHPAQWLILKDIQAHPNTTLAQISKRRSIEKPTTRKILKVLDARGWLIVTPGEDKREKLLNLSSTGQDVHNALKSKLSLVQEELLASLQLSPSIEQQTLDLLHQLHQHMLYKITQD